MSAQRTVFICSECGCEHSKWSGKCSECGTWNSISEEAKVASVIKMGQVGGEVIELFSLGDRVVDNKKRIKTEIEEFDNLLGGGLVSSMVILIAGEPGVGKSTLLLQISDAIAGQFPGGVVYISGEESVDQVASRAHRLGIGGKGSENNIQIASATKVEAIIETLEKLPECKMLVIDSIQTMSSQDVGMVSGSVSQLRASAQILTNYCKARNIILFLVGHITKEGQVAGPKLLEHIVDTVLYFETDANKYLRILRAYKNRFGSVNEIAIFEMQHNLLKEVTNASQIFLDNSEMHGNISGVSAFTCLEGSRVFIAQAESLVSASYMPSPRRTAAGFDGNRLAIIIAIINSRYRKVQLYDKEVYVSISGGIKVDDPAIDLAVAAAIISAANNKPNPGGTIYIGELGLSGNVKMASRLEARVKEAIKLGFETLYLPASTPKELKTALSKQDAVRVVYVSNISEI